MDYIKKDIDKWRSMLQSTKIAEVHNYTKAVVQDKEIAYGKLMSKRGSRNGFSICKSTNCCHSMKGYRNVKGICHCCFIIFWLCLEKANIYEALASRNNLSDEAVEFLSVLKDLQQQFDQGQILQPELLLLQVEINPLGTIGGYPWETLENVMDFLNKFGLDYPGRLKTILRPCPFCGNGVKCEMAFLEVCEEITFNDSVYGRFYYKNEHRIKCNICGKEEKSQIAMKLLEIPSRLFVRFMPNSSIKLPQYYELPESILEDSIKTNGPITYQIQAYAFQEKLGNDEDHSIGVFRHNNNLYLIDNDSHSVMPLPLEISASHLDIVVYQLVENMSAKVTTEQIENEKQHPELVLA